MLYCKCTAHLQTHRPWSNPGWQFFKLVWFCPWFVFLSHISYLPRTAQVMQEYSSLLVVYMNMEREQWRKYCYTVIQYTVTIPVGVALLCSKEQLYNWQNAAGVFRKFRKSNLKIYNHFKPHLLTPPTWWAKLGQVRSFSLPTFLRLNLHPTGNRSPCEIQGVHASVCHFNK